MQNTPNYNYNLPEYSDSADIAVLNANFSSIDANEYRIEGKLNALGNDIALPYDNTATYSVGDYTIYSNALYRCITAIATAEDFDSTKWTAITIGGELKSHDTRISTLEAGVDLEKSATNSFDYGIDSYFKKVESSIVPVQAGTGTPSPTNVRIIGGFTECTVTDADDETDPTQINTATISFGSDVGSDTVEFNQLISGLISSTTKDGLTITDNGDGSVSISGTAEATGTADLSNIFTVPRNNNVIFFNCVFSNALSDGNYLYFGGYGTSYLMTERGRFFKRNDGTDWSSYIVLHYESGTTINTRIWINVHNLTQMFDSSTADYIYNLEQSTSGAGVAWFRTLYPKNYYPYNTGELMSVVYGGYVDLISGKLVVDRGYLAPTAVQSVSQASGTYYWVVATAIGGVDGGVDTIMSSHFEGATGLVAGHTYVIGGGNNLVAIPTDQTLNTKALADAWLQANNPQFVYKLATPQEYQLTPAQLRSLVGANRLTSSTGEVIEVEYIKNETIAWLLDLIRA